MLPITVPPCDFSLSHYRQILFRAVQLGYRFYTHYDYATGRQKGHEPFILLRHDIDFSLKHAVPLLEIEKEFGIRSSVFVRAHASGYNLFDLDNYAILDNIKRSGFEIALHYEPLFMLLTREDPLGLLKRAKSVLEGIINAPVHGLISHAPRLSPLLKDIDESTLTDLGFKYNGSDAKFTNSCIYFSDANRRWRNGCACSFIGKHSRIRILVHPYWWRTLHHDERYQSIERLRQGK